MDGALFDLLRQRPQLIFAIGVVALFLLVLGGSGLYVFIRSRLNRVRPAEGENVFKSELNALAERRA